MNDLIVHCRSQRQIAAMRFGRCEHPRAKSYELGQMQAYDDILRQLEIVASCECTRQDCRRRMDAMKQIYDYVNGVLVK